MVNNFSTITALALSIVALYFLLIVSNAITINVRWTDDLMVITIRMTKISRFFLSNYVYLKGHNEGFFAHFV